MEQNASQSTQHDVKTRKPRKPRTPKTEKVGEKAGEKQTESFVGNDSKGDVLTRGPQGGVYKVKIVKDKKTGNQKIRKVYYKELNQGKQKMTLEEGPVKPEPEPRGQKRKREDETMALFCDAPTQSPTKQPKMYQPFFI